MTGLASRWRAFEGRVSATESATAQALFRIGLGLAVWCSVGPVVWRGLVPVLWVDREDGGMLSLGAGPGLVAALGGPHPSVAWGLVVAVLGAATGLVVGVGGRPAALVALLAMNALAYVNLFAGGSSDLLLTNGLWLVVLGGGHHTLSLAARWRTGRWWPAEQVWAAPRWLAAYQLVLMYTTTGLQKLSVDWVPGGDASALYYILQQPEWQRGSMAWVAPWFPLTQLATAVTWWWEVLSPVWLWATWLAAHPERGGAARAWVARLRVRSVFAAIGIGMHLLILAWMEVGPFSVISLAYYAVMVHPDEWERALRRR